MACRETAERDELIRYVLSPDGQVILDYRGRLPGRGAWLHVKGECVAKLEERPGMLQRALKAPAEVHGIREGLLGAVVEAMLDGLSMAAAAGALIGGQDVLEQALRENRIVEVLVANDASMRTVASLRTAADAAVAFSVVPLGRDALGARVGRGSRAALGVTASRAASHLSRQLRRLRALG